MYLLFAEIADKVWKEGNKMKCPVCEKHEFDHNDDFDVCPICGWENDGIQNADPDYKGGANYISLNEAREQYRETKQRIEKHGIK